MEFTQAVRTVLLSKYAMFDGRAARSEYWWFVLFTFLVYIVIIIIAQISETLGGILYVVFALGVVIPTIAVQVRRLHDTDRSGWWLLIALVPLVGGILLLVWYCTPGTPDENRFGSNPLKA